MSKKIEDGEYNQSPTKILVPIDGSQNSIRALDTAIVLSKAFRAELLVLCVVRAPNILVEVPMGLGVSPTSVSDYYAQEESSAVRFIDAAISILKDAGVNRYSCEVIRASRSIVEEIIEIARKSEVDLIVVGTRGLGGFKKLLQGSVSNGVVTHAGCNVLVVR